MTASRASTIHIAFGLSLTPDAVTQTFAILGVRGSGKTNTGVVLAEQLLANDQQVVVLDPVDVWWGLKSSKDGKHGGFAIPIIGGEHGDVPLEGTGGVVIADFIVDNRASAVISLRHLSMNDQRRFAADFARHLYERKGLAQFRTPMMLIVDEADEFMPQRIPSGHESMFGAFDRIVRRGRSSGIGVTAITQRPQVLNKDILSQMETLIAHRVLHKLDRKALEAWIEAHDTEGRGDEFMASLASLDRGDAWIWSPSWLGVFKRVHINARSTFDSSGTPKAGQHVAPPKKLAEVDLDKLRQSMSATIEKQKADDPRELRRQIADLTKHLTTKTKSATVDPLALAKAMEQGRNEALREVRDRMEALKKAMKRFFFQVSGFFENGKAVCESFKVETLDTETDVKSVTGTPSNPALQSRPQLARRNEPRPREAVKRAVSNDTGATGKLPVGERSILTACAQYWDTGCTRDQITVLIGYKRSSRDTYIQRLAERGFVNPKGPNGAVICTDEGRAALGSDFEPLPTGEALRDYWIGRLPEGEKKILEVLITAYPKAVHRERLSEEIGYKRSSRDTYLQRLGYRKLVEAGGPGEIRASEVLFA
jgi:hypothetical protein